jgi:hypothetical protein
MANLEGPADLGKQSSKDKDAVKLVEKLFQRAKKARLGYDKDWPTNYKFFRGVQWTEKRPSYRHSEVLNFVHSTIQTIVPILTDNAPIVEFTPENPSDTEFAKILTKLLSAKWNRDTWQMTVVDAIVDAMVYGTAISEQAWDPEAASGLGDLTFKTKDPFYCYPDPRSIDVNCDEGEYFIIAEPRDVSEIRRKYPDKASLIKPDLSDLDAVKNAKLQLEDFKVRNATDQLLLVQGERAQDEDRAPQVLLITCWMTDETVVEEKISKKQEDGKEVKGFRQKKKYPNGRKIVVANNVLLEDDHNPYIDGEFPYARMVDHILPREFWGEGEVEQLKGPQVIINKLISYMMDIFSLTGNPTWLVSTSSGIEAESITNQPGLVLEHTPGNPPIRQPGVEVQGSMFSTLDRMLEYFDKISGVHDVSRGAAPLNASGVAIDSLQEAAQTKLRLKARNMEAWLQRAGQQMQARILQFYTIPRIFRITENEEVPRYFKFAIDETIDESGEPQTIATIQDIVPSKNEFGEEEFTTEQTRQFEIKSTFDTRVSVGSSLPFRKQQREARAEKLFQLGIYDEEDLLTDLEHPRKEQIMEKIVKRKQAEAQAVEQQQLQQQGAIAPQGQPLV